MPSKPKPKTNVRDTDKSNVDDRRPVKRTNSASQSVERARVRTAANTVKKATPKKVSYAPVRTRKS